MAVEISTSSVDRALNGVLIIDKPSGWTSHDVVAKVRRLIGAAKVGHTGTLDPAATGVLVLCVGKATRIAEYLMLTEKAYRGTLRLGLATDTQDATGTVVRSHEGSLPQADAIGLAMTKFVGVSQQIPPMYSAVKVHGVPLYKSARAGHTVDRASRECHVRELSVISIFPTPPDQQLSGGTPTLDVVFDVTCSKGTYIRTLCADIGDALGVGGHLAGLERRRVGRFELEQAVTLEELAQLIDRQTLSSRMHSISEALAELPALTIDALSAERVRHGSEFPTSGILQTNGRWACGTLVRLYAMDGTLLGIGKVPSGSEDLQPITSSDIRIKIEKVLV